MPGMLPQQQQQMSMMPAPFGAYQQQQQQQHYGANATMQPPQQWMPPASGYYPGAMQAYPGYAMYGQYPAPAQMTPMAVPSTAAALNSLDLKPKSNPLDNMFGKKDASVRPTQLATPPTQAQVPHPVQRQPPPSVADDDFGEFTSTSSVAPAVTAAARPIQSAPPALKLTSQPLSTWIAPSHQPARPVQPPPQQLPQATVSSQVDFDDFQQAPAHATINTPAAAPVAASAPSASKPDIASLMMQNLSGAFTNSATPSKGSGFEEHKKDKTLAGGARKLGSTYMPKHEESKSSVNWSAISNDVFADVRPSAPEDPPPPSLAPIQPPPQTFVPSNTQPLPTLVLPQIQHETAFVQPSTQAPPALGQPPLFVPPTQPQQTQTFVGLSLQQPIGQATPQHDDFDDFVTPESAPAPSVDFPVSFGGNQSLFNNYIPPSSIDSNQAPTIVGFQSIAPAQFNAPALPSMPTTAPHSTDKYAAFLDVQPIVEATSVVEDVQDGFGDFAEAPVTTPMPMNEEDFGDFTAPPPHTTHGALDPVSASAASVQQPEDIQALFAKSGKYHQTTTQASTSPDLFAELAKGTPAMSTAPITPAGTPLPGSVPIALPKLSLPFEVFEQLISRECILEALVLHPYLMRAREDQFDEHFQTKIDAARMRHDLVDVERLLSDWEHYKRTTLPHEYARWEQVAQGHVAGAIPTFDTMRQEIEAKHGLERALAFSERFPVYLPAAAKHDLAHAARLQEEIFAHFQKLTSPVLHKFLSKWMAVVAAATTDLLSAQEILSQLDNLTPSDHEALKKVDGLQHFIKAVDEIARVLRRIERGAQSQTEFLQECDLQTLNSSITNTMQTTAKIRQILHQAGLDSQSCSGELDTASAPVTTGFKEGCAVCLCSVNTGHRVVWAGELYHAPCANFWFNRVNSGDAISSTPDSN